MANPPPDHNDPDFNSALNSPAPSPPAHFSPAPSSPPVAGLPPLVPDPNFFNLNGLLDPDHPLLNPPARDAPAPAPPQRPWDFLKGHTRPPLFQGLAPHLPPDKGIQHLQYERQQWRQAWPTYAQSLKNLVERMLRDERIRHGEARQIESLESTIRSIDDDIFETLSANPDLNPGPRGLPRTSQPRTTPSYLAYSAERSQYLLSQLERDLGNGENPHWPSGPLSTRLYGQNYPGDAFREILHYRPATEKPARLSLWFAKISSVLPTSWPPQVQFLFRVLVIVGLLWILFAIFSSVFTVQYRFSERICGSHTRAVPLKAAVNVVYQVSGTMKQISPQGVPK